MTRSEWSASIALLLVIVFGTWVRLNDLGGPELSNDELDLYTVASSLAAGQGPLLPSGREYSRGREVSRLIVVARRFVSDPETAARLPSALFGVLGLVLLAAIAWNTIGIWGAVWATLLLAIYPEALQQSRNSRFYTYQLVFGLIALYAGWRAAAATARLDSRPDGTPAGDRPAADRAPLRRGWAWVLVTGLALLFAMRIQVTTASIAAGWGTAMALFALMDLHQRGRAAWRASVPLQVAVLGLLGVVLLAAVSPDTILRYARLSQHLPPWARLDPAPPLAYYYGLAEALPLVVSLAPLIFATAIWQRPRFGLYLLCWFAVPLALHSFVFPFRAQRFVLLALPALFLATAIAAVTAARALRDATVTALTPPFGPARARLAALVLVLVVGLGATVTAPAFSRARKADRESTRLHPTDWRAVRRVIADTPGSDRIPLGVSEAMQARHYLGRADFVVTLGTREQALTIGFPLRDSSRVPSDTLVRDAYTGAPILETVPRIRALWPHARTILIAVDPVRGAARLSPDLAAALHDSAVELCDGRCGNMRLYLWRPAGGSAQVDTGLGRSVASRGSSRGTPEPGVRRATR